MDQSLDFIERATVRVYLLGSAINAGVGVLAADDFVKGVYSDQPARDRNERHRGANQVAVRWIARPINPRVYDLDEVHHHDLQKFPHARSTNRHRNQPTVESRTSQFNRVRSVVGISADELPTFSYQMFRLPLLRVGRQPQRNKPSL
jgi:hypothetical protein